MTEISKVKEALKLILSANINPRMSLRDVLTNELEEAIAVVVVNSSSLLTTIESQQQEIDKQKIIHADYRRTALERIAYQEKQIESQKEEIECWQSLHPEVQWFAEQMELALRENDHKCGWKDEHQSWLLGELHRNAGKIFDSRYSLHRVVNVANFAMMIADNSRTQEGDK